MRKKTVSNLAGPLETRVYRRRVTCPTCGWRLIDACHREPIDIADLRSSQEVSWEPDFVARCQRCKNEFGIRKKN